MTDDLAFLDAVAQADLVRRGELSPLELVDAAITRVEKVNGQLNAVIHPRFDEARAEASGSLPDGPFRGVPIVLKDLDAVSTGDPLHYGNVALKTHGRRGDHDTWLVARLRGAGFVVVGKTNTPEFGLMPTTEPLAYGPTRNPWNTEHGTGGSSGGSAAAVASGMVPAGHAGDGGGSIRIPASACGLFGLKPTRGRTSLGPDAGESWSGMVVRHVVTRSVRDSAAILDVHAGPMPGDPYFAAPPSRPFAAEVGVEPATLRIGLRTTAPAEMAPTDPECEAAAHEAATLLRTLGHHVVDASPAALDDVSLMADFTTVLTTGVVHDVQEVARAIGRDVTADDVEPLTWAYYEAGLQNSAIQYLEAINSSHAWSRKMASWWTPRDAGGEGFDLLLTPTLASPPPVIGDLVGPPDDPWRGMARATEYACYTAPFNVTGQPAMSVPLTWQASSNLPIGVQLVAGYGREDLLVRLASQLEAAAPWADRRPVVHA